MRKLLISLGLLALGSTPLWAPPYSPTIAIVSSPPSGACTSNEIREVKSSGDQYACLGGVWTLLKISPQELDATNTAAVGLCVQVDPSDAAKFQFIACSSGSGGGGTSTIKESGTAVTTVASTLNLGAGFDVTRASNGDGTDTATVVLDYTEDPVNLASSEVSGTLPLTAGGTGATDAAGARNAIAAAKSGANTDITSLGGSFTTPLPVTNGGTGLSTIAAHQVMVGTASNIQTAKTIPNCPSGNQLLYTQSTDTWGCEADGSAGSGSVRIIQDEGSSLGSDGSGTTLNFVGSALTASGTGTVKTITLAQTGTGTSVVDNAYTLTGGSGINITGLDAAQALTGSNLTITTDTNEASAMAVGAVSCAAGASDAGKFTYQNSIPFQYCDGTTSARYGAYGDSSGNSLTGDSATSFFSTGTLEIARGGTGSGALGSAGQVVYNAGGNALTATSGLAFDSATGNLTAAGSFISSGAQAGSRYVETQSNGTTDVLPASGYGRLYSKAAVAGQERPYWVTVSGGVDTIPADIPTDDRVFVANGTDWISTTLPDCNLTTQKLIYTTATNSFSCQTDVSGGSVSGTNLGLVYNSSGTAVAISAMTWTNPTTNLDVADGTRIVMGTVNNSSDLEGFIIPQQTGAPANGFTTVDGQIDWDSTNNIPYWGNGNASPDSWTQGVTTTATQTLTNKTLTAPVISTISNTGTLTLPTSTDTLVGRDTTDTLTHKTLNVESTSNDITIVDKVWFQAAGCNNTTATSFFDLQTVSVPSVACLTTGGGTTLGVLQFDDTSDEGAQATLALPSDWTGAIDAKLKWRSAGNTGTVEWCVQLACIADAEVESTLTFNAMGAGNCTNDAAKGTTLQLNDATIPGVTATGCAAGELMHIRVARDADGTVDTDNTVGDAELLGLEITLRRTQ